jgi:hypothetical protein
VRGAYLWQRVGVEHGLPVGRPDASGPGANLNPRANPGRTPFEGAAVGEPDRFVDRRGQPRAVGEEVSLMAASWQTRWCVATLLVGMPVCSGGHAEPRVTPSVWVRSTSPGRVRQDVEAAYRAMWMDMAAAAKTADYQSPRLARHASGDALSTLVKAHYDVKQRGVVVKGELLLAPQVISLTPSQAAREATSSTVPMTVTGWRTSWTDRLRTTRMVGSGMSRRSWRTTGVCGR